MKKCDKEVAYLIYGLFCASAVVVIGVFTLSGALGFATYAIITRDYLIT